jgi:hypothetical protein
VGIGEDGTRRRLGRVVERDAARVRRGQAVLVHDLRDGARVHLGQVQAQPAGVEARQVEDVVDETQESLGVAADHDQLLAHRGILVGLEQALDGRDDERERRAQLVRDVGEEGVLALVHLLEARVDLLELGGGQRLTGARALLAA